VSKAYRNINSHTRYRVRQWLCAKFKERGQGKKRGSWAEIGKAPLGPV